MTKEIYLKNIRQGDKVASSFLVAEKNMAFSQKGSPYLTVKLRDRTGEIESKVWENAIELDKLFKKGDIIFIEGRAANYKNSIQISIINLKKILWEEVEPADYLPAVKGDVRKMFGELLGYIEKINDKFLKALLDAFFQNEETVSLFQRAPAAKGFHHIYLGGLLEHTLSVVRLLDKVSGHYSVLDKDMLITGGILHDIGKIYEFSYNNIIDYSDEGRLIGHIVMGVEMINQKIAAIENFPQQLALELRHIILSHHGEFEFGSPKRPKTLEALVVHYIDDLDAKFNAFQTFMNDSPDNDSDWTAYNRFLERFLYKKRVSDPDIP
ncbi:MAG: HD domain-containing protein [Deltaproteobacteria bacterium]|nr:HD domain-containing protein [Deltaproteobacteria bacterium]